MDFAAFMNLMDYSHHSVGWRGFMNFFNASLVSVFVDVLSLVSALN